MRQHQVLEATQVATQCPGSVGEVGSEVTDVGDHRRRHASVTSTSTRKSSVTGAAVDLLAKLVGVRRKMKSADDVIEAV